eukprot:jgi/Chlat1/721/Chrsp104S01208
MDGEGVDERGAASSLRLPPRQGKHKGGAPRSAVWAHFDTAAGRNNKNRRTGCVCKHCGRFYSDARVEFMVRHIVSECREITPDIRAQVAELSAAKRGGGNNKHASNAASASTVPALFAGNSSKSNSNRLKRRAEQPAAPVASKQHQVGTALPSAVQSELDTSLLLMFVMTGMPFHIVEDYYFRKIIHTMRPGYQPPSAAKLRTQLLEEHHALVQRRFTERMSKETGCTSTFIIDGWSDLEDRYVYGCNVAMPDKLVHLLKCVQFPIDCHEHEEIASKFKDCIDQVGALKVAAVVTDNAANMQLVRSLLVDTAGYTHIQALTCLLRGFLLTMGSFLGHPWVKSIAVNALKVALYFRDLDDQTPLALLSDAAKACNIAGSIHLVTKQLPSLLRCLQSVQRLEPALMLVGRHPANIASAEVISIIDDREFWRGLDTVCHMLKPFNHAMLAAQSTKTATLADVTRYWLHVARAIDTQRLPSGAQQHVTQAYNAHVAELDFKLARLALFLDPRYKQSADEDGHFGQLLEQAVRVMQKRGHSEEECRLLLAQMQNYKGGLPPYDHFFGGESFDVKGWWLSVVRTEQTKEIVGLAVMLLDIVPHAADPDRLLTSMGWFNSSTWRRLPVHTVGMMTAIRMHHTHEDAKAAKQPSNINTSQEAAQQEERDAALLGQEEAEGGIVDCDELDAVLETLYATGTASTADAAVQSDSVSSLLSGFVLQHHTLSPSHKPAMVLPPSLQQLFNGNPSTNLDAGSNLQQHLHTLG